MATSYKQGSTASMYDPTTGAYLGQLGLQGQQNFAGVYAQDSSGNVTGLVGPSGAQFYSLNRLLDRPPTVYDNLSKGYAASSIWQSGGKIYQPVAAPDTTSAAWGMVTDSGGTFTSIATAAATKFAGGLMQMASGYVGVACIVTVTIATVATTFSINILSNGELDNEAMRSAIGQADAGTLPVITQLNDQSGATNHATQAAATAPYVEWDALMGRYVLAFDRPSITTRILTLPVGVSVTGNSWSAAVYGRGIVSANNSQHFTFGLINGGLFNTVAAFSNGYVNPIRSGTQIGVGNIPLDSNPSIMIVTESTLAQTLAVNDYSGSTGISNDTTVYSGGYIGSYASGAGACTHKIVGFAVCNTTLSTAQQTAIRTDAYIRLNILPQVLDQVFIIGDSRVANGRGSPVQTISTELANRLGRTARVFNFGNDSKTSVDVATLTIPTAVSLYKTNAKNTVIYLTGINDFQVGWGGGAGTVTAAQSLAQIKTNITTLKNAGFTVILMNELATTSTTGGANTGLVALRALITAAGASGMGADYLVDLLQYTPFTLPSNTLYYADGVHPTTAADALWASVIAPLIQSSSTVITKT